MGSIHELNEIFLEQFNAHLLKRLTLPPLLNHSVNGECTFCTQWHMDLCVPCNNIKCIILLAFKHQKDMTTVYIFLGIWN